MSSKYSQEDKAFFRSKLEYQESVLYARINIFIVASAILMNVFGLLFVTAKISIANHVVSIFGIVLTLVMWLAIWRQSVVVEDIRRFLRDAVQDTAFADLGINRKQLDATRFSPSGKRLMFTVLPFLFLLFWIGALAISVLGKMNLIVLAE